MKRLLLIAAVALLLAVPASAGVGRADLGPCSIDIGCPEPEPLIQAGTFFMWGLILDEVGADGNVLRWSEIVYSGWIDQYGDRHTTQLEAKCPMGDPCGARQQIESGWRPPGWEGGW